MSGDQQKQAKYSFDLLETPISSVTSVDPLSSGTARRPSSSSSSFIAPPSNVRIGDGSHTHSVRSSSSTLSRTTRTTQSNQTGSVNTTDHTLSSSTIPRCVTPGSRRVHRTPHGSYSATPRNPNTAYVVALVEGRGLARGEIGMACIDLKSPVLVVSQFSDSQTYIKVMTKLQILQPAEIIMPNTVCESGNMTTLFKQISNTFQNANIATVQRKYFNETKGLQYIKQLSLPECTTVEMELAGKYYCLATTAALLKYVEFIQNVVYAPSSLKVIFKGSEMTTMIDSTTAGSLELLQNLQDPKSEHTLFGMLNFTKTTGGARLLRSNILQPPCDLETITTRLDAVQELTENEELFYNLQSVLSRFMDIDHLLSLCVQLPKQETLKTAENKITNVIYLKHTLELVEPLKEALKDSTNSLFKAYHDTLGDSRFDVIREKVHSVIHEDTRFQKGSLNMRTQKCFAVKPNINGLLDVARRTYTEIVDDISELIKQLSTEHMLPLKTGYSVTRGFYIHMTCGGKDGGPSAAELPGIFIKVNKFKNTISFTTTDLIKMNDRIRESLQEICLISNVVVSELLTDIRSQIGCLYKLTECVASLDLLVSLAHACSLSEYVRPEFTDTLAVKQGRHPILDKISVETPVPNNVYASDESNFLIITGPNMSGKSTYLRQIALLQIMAQIGSWVPADFASFRVCDQIFSRIGSDDDIETNSSTFMLEMREINYIIQNASATSLIIIDELGRGTSADEGIGISQAVCEHLLSLKAFTFFATHFCELTNLGNLYPNVENYHFEVQRLYAAETHHEKLQYTHVLSKGISKEKHYGIELAQVSTLPSSIVEDAKLVAKAIAEQKEQTQGASLEARKHRAVYKLASRLSQAAHNSRLDEHTLRMYLQNLKKQYQEELQEDASDS
ncbi:mutS protein homolog 4 [Lingula anatina]|uniref:MutS protein homolog 4 n=1 Tax=Lingula anatina TaxID=7574 RepID=A0A1S3J8M3_LINAN|nr:mutS protein homolog 4 [Lingula anatina]|eukprot:XP_013406219.1 mutS protein homolog 4 [Lingula anatina]